MMFLVDKKAKTGVEFTKNILQDKLQKDLQLILRQNPLHSLLSNTGCFLLVSEQENKLVVLLFGYLLVLASDLEKHILIGYLLVLASDLEKHILIHLKEKLSDWKFSLFRDSIQKQHQESEKGNPPFVNGENPKPTSSRRLRTIRGALKHLKKAKFNYTLNVKCINPNIEHFN